MQFYSNDNNTIRPFVYYLQYLPATYLAHSYVFFCYFVFLHQSIEHAASVVDDDADIADVADGASVSRSESAAERADDDQGSRRRQQQRSSVGGAADVESAGEHDG